MYRRALLSAIAGAFAFASSDFRLQAKFASPPPPVRGRELHFFHRPKMPPKHVARRHRTQHRTVR